MKGDALGRSSDSGCNSPGQTGGVDRKKSVMAAELRHVSKVYRRSSSAGEALRDVTVQVKPGEFVAIVGPSGCGKTTLLNVLAGLVPPTSGEVRVNGSVVDGVPASVGMMFQNPVLLDWFTVERNITLPNRIGQGRRQARHAAERAEALLRLVGLDGLADRYPRELSGGMRQRVAICRMLANDPDLLLMDEPFGALDELLRERLNYELGEIIVSARKTAILITHSVQEAVFLADTVIVFAGPPGHPVGQVEVASPRPRDIRWLETDEFMVHASEVRQLLRQQDGEGSRAAEEDGRSDGRAHAEKVVGTAFAREKRW